MMKKICKSTKNKRMKEEKREKEQEQKKEKRRGGGGGGGGRRGGGGKTRNQEGKQGLTQRSPSIRGAAGGSWSHESGEVRRQVA